MLGNCEHELRIKGTKTDVEKVLDYIADDEFDFDKIIPEPKTKEECLNSCAIGFTYIIDTKSNLREDWFKVNAWREMYWHSEWKGVVTKLQKISANEAIISYNTYAEYHSNSTPIIEKIQELYPKLYIEYQFRSFEFVTDICIGDYTTKNGWKKYRIEKPNLDDVF